MNRKSIIRKHTDLEVYQRAFSAAMALFHESKSWPIEEKFSLIDQCRRSSRSVASNIAEAWRKRRYPAAFASQLSDSEAECAETQTWIHFAVECGYLDRENARKHYSEYDQLTAMLVTMITTPENWQIPKP